MSDIKFRRRPTCELQHCATATSHARRAPSSATAVIASQAALPERAGRSAGFKSDSCNIVSPYYCRSDVQLQERCTTVGAMYNSRSDVQLQLQNRTNYQLSDLCLNVQYSAGIFVDCCGSLTTILLYSDRRFGATRMWFLFTKHSFSIQSGSFVISQLRRSC
jgi:hypothetical protein